MARFAPLSRLPRPVRWLVRALAVVLVLALALVGLVTWTIRRSFPQLEGSVLVPGLSGDVTVLRDRWGVPHIYADSAEDLFRAQGYVHAQDRFWEMDFRRHVTAGRLSELFGAATLDADKVVRTLGWRRVAERELELISVGTRRYLEVYAEGVNAWMRRHSGAQASLEYAILRLQNGAYKPEPWTPADSLAWLKAMAWDLRANMVEELSRALAAAKVPVPRVEQLYPGYPYGRHPTIVDGDAADSGRSTSAMPSRPLVLDGRLTVEAARRAARAVASLPNLLGDGAPGIGSNAWVVPGARTTTGKPLLANDPHLAPRMPSLWYQAGLHCRTRSAGCPFDVTGYTFSGMPGVVIGHNDRIAWGFANLAADVADLYVERITGEGYQYRRRRLPFQVRTEQIKVAGGTPVTITVRSTRHGPLLSEVMGDMRDAVRSAPAARGGRGGSYGIALRWTALDPGRTADALFRLNAARDWKDLRAAAARFEVPAQNVVYADVDGNIGYQAPGKIPVRAKGDGRWPVPGWTGDHEWQGYIPFGELPSVLNPSTGPIVAANNAVTGPGYPWLLTTDWSYGYRAQRIAERLRQQDRIDLDGMASLQLDVHNPFASTLVPHLLRVGAAGGGPEALGLLGGWDFAQDTGSAPAAFYNAVWRHLLLRTFNDELPEGARPGGEDRWFEVVRSLLDRPDDPWWDDVTTSHRKENRDDVLRAALADASAELHERLGDDPSAWTWGDLHTLELTHETFGVSGIAPIEWLFNRGPFRLGGGPSIVDAVGWNVQEGYQVDWVPSMRMVVDLADLDRSRWINLTGNSGHAFAEHYWDQAPLWAAGRTIPMLSTPPVVQHATVDRLTLQPTR
jgi:penicillin amidase